jgi:Pin2-interacting protein X1
VLGRLNGKSEEELQKQQDALKDAELKTWHEQRYGLLGFVRGGWLVGDRIVEENQGKNVDVGPKDFKEDKKSKKRKAEDDTVVESGLSTKKLKKDKGSKQLRSTTTPQGRVSQDVKLSKPASKEGSGTGRSGNDEDSSPSSTQGTKKRKSKHGKVNKDDEPEASSSDDDRAKRKAEKRARKEARRKRKEEKAAKNAKNAPALKDSDRTGTSGTSTPQESASTGYSTPVFGRQAVRQRYIQQKRMASMDPQAMREIFMLKAAG